MFEDYFEEQVLMLHSGSETCAVNDFLKKQGLSLEKGLEYSMIIKDNDQIAATGSFYGRVLKCIAVDDKYKGLGLSARVISHLVKEQFRRGRTHLFIYTKPDNRHIFSELGFYPIAEVPDKVVLMENRKDGIQRYLDEIAEETGSIIPSGSVVVNCNPFTKGHKYLLEYAASRCRMLHVFVVWEDKSVFPAEIRYRLVKEGACHLSNVIVHKGKDYIISNATFPSYFIKKYEDVIETHANLDLMIFSQYIAKKLDIRKRFVGKEPYCPVTSVYNQVMNKILPKAGIEVEEIPRMESGGIAISASHVRKLLSQNDMNAVKELVPENTWQFLLTDEGKEIVRKIQIA